MEVRRAAPRPVPQNWTVPSREVSGSLASRDSPLGNFRLPVWSMPLTCSPERSKKRRADEKEVVRPSGPPEDKRAPSSPISENIITIQGKIRGHRVTDLKRLQDNEDVGSGSFASFMVRVPGPALGRCSVSCAGPFTNA